MRKSCGSCQDTCHCETRYGDESHFVGTTCAACGGAVEAAHKVWPVKAYRNHEFLSSHEARPIRVQCELIEPEVRLKRHGIEHTIVFFGSARIKRPEVAAAHLEEVQQHRDKYTLEHIRNAERDVRVAEYYTHAVELARRLTEWSLGIENPAKRLHIITGGGPGIMEAASKGSRDGGGRPIGMNITLPHESSLNPYCDPEVSFKFHYFFVRKYWLFYLTKALVVFPGGFGTMDELFEVLTLMQTKKTKKYVPTVLFGGDFWRSLFNFEVLCDWGVIAHNDLSLFKVADTVDEAFEYLTTELTKHYL